MGAAFIGSSSSRTSSGTPRWLGASDPPGGRVHGRRPAIGQARGVTRRTDHAPGRVPLLPPRVPHDAPPLEGGLVLPGGGPRLRVHRHRRRVRGDARFPLAHGLGPGRPGRDGVGNGRPPTRPRRRVDDLDPRSAPRRRVRLGDGHVDRDESEATTITHATQMLQMSFAGADRWPSSTRSTPIRSPPPPRRRSSTGTSGPMWRASSRS